MALVRHLPAGTRPIKCHLLPLQVAFYDLLFFMPLWIFCSACMTNFNVQIGKKNPNFQPLDSCNYGNLLRGINNCSGLWYKGLRVPWTISFKVDFFFTSALLIHLISLKSNENSKHGREYYFLLLCVSIIIEKRSLC